MAEKLKGKTGGIVRAETVSTTLQRIAEEARRDPGRVFTNLAHVMDVPFLKEAYRRLNKKAAPGVDEVTHKEYGWNLDAHLQDLHTRLREKRYRAQPMKRGWVPKDEKTRRPIAKAVLEDKIVQRAVAMLLGAIYEQDFHEFSRGFRERRSALQAIAEIRRWCMEEHIHWILDADICGYFDTISWRLLREVMKKRVNDGSIVRLIGKWLHVGIVEGEEVTYPEKGTPQGAVISPLLSNIYLHYVLDDWFEREVKPQLKGRAFLSRFADDFIIGFEAEEDARKMMQLLKERMEQYELTLHGEKTKLVRFGKPPMSQHGGKGEGTFEYLGFTHYWARTRRGYWVIKRKTRSKKRRATIKGIWMWCRNNRHMPIDWQHKMLCMKLRGHYQYFGIRCNYRSMKAVYEETKRSWRYWLSRRGQPNAMTWKQLEDMLSTRFPLPMPRIIHSI